MSEYQPAQNVFKFPDTVRGTTLKGQSFEVFKNNAAPPASLSSVTCIFAKDGVVTLTCDTTITDAANWHFSVDEVDAEGMDIASGIHTGEIKTTDSDGVVRKYIQAILTILPSVP